MKPRHLVLGGLFLLGIITMADRVALAVAGTSIQHDLGLTAAQWGWVLGLFSLAYGIFEMPTGAMGDRIGPRRVLTRIVLWWSGFTALTGLARNFAQLAIIRFLFGAGEAGAYPNMAGVVRRWFPASERARAQGLIWAASRLGGAVCPLLLIPLQRMLGWRGAMQVCGGVGAVWAIGWFLLFRDDPPEAPEDSRGFVPPVAPGRWFAQPGLRWLMAMYYAYSWSGYFYQSWMFVFLQNARAFTAAQLMAFSWLPFACGAAANLAGGWAGDALVARVGLTAGRRAIGLGGLALSALFIGAAALTRGKALTLIWLALGYAASDFMMPSAWAACLDLGRERVGAVSGAMNMAGQAGGFSSSVAFGYLVGATGSYDLALWPLAGLTGLAALAWLKIDPARRAGI